MTDNNSASVKIREKTSLLVYDPTKRLLIKRVHNGPEENSEQTVQRFWNVIEVTAGIIETGCCDDRETRYNGE